MSHPAPRRTRVFISYSHHDKQHLERLLTHLTPLQREGKVDVWADMLLQPGDEWREEIRQALATAQVAIVLVSADFRASKFIAEHELPPLLSAAKSEGVLIIPVVVGPCDFHESELAHVQAANEPSRPLSTLSPHERDAVWVNVVRRVRRALDENAPHEPAAPPVHVYASSPRVDGPLRSTPELQERASAKANGPGPGVDERQQGSRAAHPRDHLTALQSAYQHDLEAFETYWTGVFYGPNLDAQEVEKYHRLADDSLPTWRHRLYASQVEAHILELDPQTVARIHTLQQRLDLFEVYRSRMRDHFETEPAKQLWHEYEAWKRAHEHGSLAEQLKAQDQSAALSKRVNDFVLPSVEVWNTCAALVNHIREAGNPISVLATIEDTVPATPDAPRQEECQAAPARSPLSHEAVTERPQPAVVPTRDPPRLAGRDGVEYFDADSAQHREILLNAGAMPAFNIWGILLGPPVDESLHILDRRRTFLLGGPLMPGQQQEVDAAPGRTIVPGDAVVGDKQPYALCAPSEPSLGDLLSRDIPRVLVRCTITYRSVQGAKYATVSDFTPLRGWTHTFLADIPKGIDELDRDARQGPTPTA